MNLSYSYFTRDTTLPWTPEASGILASFRIILYNIEKTFSHSCTRLSQNQNNWLSLYGRGLVFNFKKTKL